MTPDGHRVAPHVPGKQVWDRRKVWALLRSRYKAWGRVWYLTSRVTQLEMALSKMTAERDELKEEVGKDRHWIVSELEALQADLVRRR